MGDGCMVITDMQHAVITPGHRPHWKDETVEGLKEIGRCYCFRSLTKKYSASSLVKDPSQKITISWKIYFFISSKSETFIYSSQV